MLPDQVGKSTVIDRNDTDCEMLVMDRSIDAAVACGGDDIMMGHPDPRILICRLPCDHVPRPYLFAVIQRLCALSF